MNNNSFIVEIPKELKHIKAKLFFGLTKRQLIGFLCSGLVGLPVFFLVKRISIDMAMYASFICVFPVLFITIFQKGNMYAETWIKLYLEYNILNKHQRKIKRTKRNRSALEERGIRNVRANNITKSSKKNNSEQKK